MKKYLPKLGLLAALVPASCAMPNGDLQTGAQPPAQPVSREFCQQSGGNPQTCAQLPTQAQLAASLRNPQYPIVQESCRMQPGATREQLRACAQFATTAQLDAARTAGRALAQQQARPSSTGLGCQGTAAAVGAVSGGALGALGSAATRGNVGLGTLLGAAIGGAGGALASNGCDQQPGQAVPQRGYGVQQQLCPQQRTQDRYGRVFTSVPAYRRYDGSCPPARFQLQGGY